MRIEVYEDVRKAPPVARLRLFQNGDSVQLRAVADDGSKIMGACLLTISKDGIERHGSVDPKVGLPLDDKGRVMLVD